jgi:hypothetical protein
MRQYIFYTVCFLLVLLVSGSGAFFAWQRYFHKVSLVVSTPAPVLFPFSDTNTPSSEALQTKSSSVLQEEASNSQTSVCDTPLQFSLGAIDPRFGLSVTDVRKNLDEAIAVWEQSAQKKLFEYNEAAPFKVQLVFDTRQEGTLVAKQLERRFETAQSLQEGISSEYDVLFSQYKKQKAEYEKAVKYYQPLSDAYIKEVDDWNDKGGAPQGVYDALEAKKQDLILLADANVAKQQSINDLVKKINVLVAKEKKAVAKYNAKQATYESTYGATKQFDQGVYSGKDITIYQFRGHDDLVLVLAHELGHALGLDHASQPQSLMYYLLSQQNLNHPAPSAEDMTAVQKRCQVSR